jgi:DNA repair exonuclease SbcCD ATPase subunit
MIKKIYHLADIHIRNLHRHKEYRQVFEKFLENVKRDNIEESVIYLAGDIAHAKTEMSPELIREISWLFTECAKLRDTFIITGNHDCNLNNNYRLDVLTPIVNNLVNPRIHYLRDTGVYTFQNLTFVVYSILDHKDNWPSGYEIEGKNTIALFHGPVNKAETDVGYTVSSHSFTADMFNGFDMALLGDIHKRQVVSEPSEVTMNIQKDDWGEYEKQGWVILEEFPDDSYSIYKKTAHTVYAGSLVQQNHGEMLEKHGYLLWDVETRTYEEINIHNDYGYLTVDVVNGKIPQWVYDEIDTKLPKYPRLRLRFEGTEASEMKLRITELKKLFNVSEVTVTRTDTMSNLRSNTKLNKNIVGNVTDVTFQNHLIRDYLERQYLLEDGELDTITEFNINTNSQISKFDLAENILWTPKKFEYENMFSYGDKNKIDFSNARGIIGIFAPNATGKSSLFEALSFCIYDKTSRTHLSKNIINNQKESFWCKFQFEVDGTDYFIERRGKWVRKGNAVKVDVDFWKIEGGVEVSLNGEQRRDTNKNIEKFLGTFDDFVLTAMSVQGNNALFIDKSQSERKDVLSQFIGVDIFDKLYQVASDEHRDNRTIIRKFNSDDFTDRLAKLETDEKSYFDAFKKNTKELEKINTDIDDYTKKLISLNEQIVKLKSDTVGIIVLEERKAILERNLSTILGDRKVVEDIMDSLEELQIQIDDIMDDFDEDDLIVKNNKLKSLGLKSNLLMTEIDKLNIKKSGLESNLEHLNEHEYNPECNICVKNSKSVITKKEDVQKEIDILVSAIDTKTNEYQGVENEIKELSPYEEQYKFYIDTKSKETRVYNELNSVHSKLSALETKEVSLRNQLEIQENLIDEYLKNEEQIQKNGEIRKQITTVRTNLNTIKGQKDRLDKLVLKLNGQLSSVRTQRENIEERITEVKQLEQQSRLYDFYLNSLSRDGVSYELIEKALPMIEGEVNNILGQIVEFGMQLEIDGKSINAYLVYGDQRWSLEMCSGMERFISGLAIRVALINVCNLPRPNFLVVDEGFGSLDAENLQSLFMLFTYLKTQFDFVMIISHIDSMRDVVDDLIEIRKENGFSNVRY